MFKVALIHPNAKAPERKSSSAAGLDLYSCESAVVPPRSRKLVSTGIKIQIPNNCYARVAPRSGLSVNNICEDYTYLPCYPETETQCKIVTSVSKKQLTYGKCECNPAGGATGFCSPISSNSANYQYWLDEFNKVTQSKCPYESSTSCIQIPEKDYVNYKYAEAILNGYDIEEYYCLVSSSQYLSLSFVLVTLLAIFI